VTILILRFQLTAVYLSPDYLHYHLAKEIVAHKLVQNVDEYSTAMLNSIQQELEL